VGGANLPATGAAVDHHGRQNVQAAAADQRADQIYRDAGAILHDCLQLQAHLEAKDQHLAEQDKALSSLIAQLRVAATVPTVVVPD
jgi:hypothetical protein